uniref:uncharacterized protein LOC124045469 isoform X2 n=1 Tax=Oncorhynchus gorbuscha TaxID=8017 RepID=UPI001EAF2A2B|nr:uncharacterized protein LOC124045469 isoform X2 [Oncorhynchus gorbuscha]
MAQNNNTLLHLFAGGCSGTVGAIVTCPLEVLKTRLQSSGITLRPMFQVQLGTLNGTGVIRPGSGTITPPGLLQVLRSILEKEGPRSLFRGLGPNLVGVAPSRMAPPVTCGDRKAAPVTSCGDRMAPPVTCGDRMAAPVISCGDRMAAPVTRGDRMAAPVTSCGDRMAPPVTCGDRMSPPVTCGDRMAAPVTSCGDRMAALVTSCGDRMAALVTSCGDRMAAPVTRGDRMAAPVTRGDRMSAPVTRGDRMAEQYSEVEENKAGPCSVDTK